LYPKAGYGKFAILVKEPVFPIYWDNGLFYVQNKSMKSIETQSEVHKVLISIRGITSNFLVISYVARFMWWLLEILCYLLFLASIFIAFVFISPLIEVGRTDEVRVMALYDKFTVVVYAIRIIIILMGIFMLLPAWLIRKIRKKNNQIKKVHELAAGYLAKEGITK
jgi:hypothetical protein